MKLETAKGARDFPPEEKIAREGVAEKLKRVFELYGYPPFETPVIERFDVLSAKGGAGEGSDALKETFRLTDQGGRKLGLRFELTLSLARFIGMNPGLKMPFKRYEIGPVFRDGPIKLGRYRQFWQCDVDIVGAKGVLADAEIILLALDCFDALNIDAYLQINNRKLLKGIIEYSGIEKSKADSVIITIDKLEKIGKNEVIKELKQRGINQTKIKKLFSAFNLNGSNKEKINKLKRLIKNDTGKEGLDELEEICSYIGSRNIIFNPALARGLGYYTGPIFEGYLKKGAIRGSICGGGRYDNMIGLLLGQNREYPAVGISFGLDVIADSLKKEDKRTVARVYVLPIKTKKESFRILNKLREKGINADMDLMDRGISKNLDYANALNIPYVLFIGERELKENKVKLRDMKSGKEKLLSVEELIYLLKKQQLKEID